MIDQMLRPLQSNRRFKFATVDVETNDWTKVSLIGFFDGEDYYYFKNATDFLKFFLRRKYQAWRCFAHYGSGFDFAFLLQSLDEDFNWLKYSILSNNGASMIRVYDESGKRSWVFLDSFRLLPKSLAELTKTFGVEHQKMDVDRGNLYRLKKEELIKYNEYDCRGLYEVLKKFEGWFEDQKVALKATTASQAMAVFRKNIKKPFPVLKPEVEQFIKSSYFGGRTEVFKLRCYDHFYYYDVRSLYPYCMKKYPMPVGTPRRVNRFDDDNIGFYSASIKIPDMYLPPMPFVKDMKLLFPYGRVSGVYTSQEILSAIKLGCDVNVTDGYIFPDEFIFDEYVDKMYKLKESKDEVTRSIAKLMLNSLYGKFGQNRQKCTIVRPDFEGRIGLIPYDEEHGLYQKPSYSRATFIIPSIASWITSCARTELFNWLSKAGEKDVYYCDTDSVLSTRKLPIGDKLGDLKLEMEGEEGIFLSPKMYIIKQKDQVIVKAKGFEHEFANKLSFASFERALHGDKHDFIQEVQRFAKFKEALVREGKFVTMLTKRKSIQSDYSKRTVLSNFDTRPLKILA
jgi:hypothetical protein